MQKIKIREVTIKPSYSGFSIFSWASNEKKDYDFSGISSLRQLLSNEKARILDVIKNKKPGSIYELAKILKRNFKSVSEDIKLLERFGFIELVAEKTKNRIRHKPEIVVDTITINVRL
ncbi:MAG TPA: hypothetical protein VJ208_01705 [Candidatus Nanoarchaeia archaeon]|nr:hypothetical protein [Candidatus Nanoarchaeia archaeon]